MLLFLRFENLSWRKFTALQLLFFNSNGIQTAFLLTFSIKTIKFFSHILEYAKNGKFPVYCDQIYADVLDSNLFK